MTSSKVKESPSKGCRAGLAKKRHLLGRRALVVGLEAIGPSLVVADNRRNYN